MTNYVLVHGGMIGGNCWGKVRKLLEQKNNFVVAPTLTGLAERKHLSHPNICLDTHVDDVLNSIYYEDLDNITLVGHSYGGMVITALADKIPEIINKLIYVAAVLPMNEESMLDAVGPEISAYIYENAKNGNGWQVNPGPPEIYGITELNDMRWFRKMTSPHPLKSFEQKVQYNQLNFRKLRKQYIKCKQDTALNRIVERAKNMGIEICEIDAGHFPMITHPERLVDLILKFV